MEAVTAVPAGGDVTLEVDREPGSLVPTAGHIRCTSDVSAWRSPPADVDSGATAALRAVRAAL